MLTTKLWLLSLIIILVVVPSDTSRGIEVWGRGNPIAGLRPNTRPRSQKWKKLYQRSHNGEAQTRDNPEGVEPQTLQSMSAGAARRISLRFILRMQEDKRRLWPCQWNRDSRLAVTGWRTPRESCLACSAHHSIEEQGLHHHDGAPDVGVENWNKFKSNILKILWFAVFELFDNKTIICA